MMPSLSPRSLLALAATAAVLVCLCATPAAAKCNVASLNLGTSATTSPVLTVGPYFHDVGSTAVDITQGQAGAKLQIVFTVYNISDDNCATISGAAIDLWHANVAGKYSNFAAEGTADESWLRGYHVTGSNGTSAFTTIYPGWYSGRTVHMHTKLRLLSGSTTTYEQNTQLFFPASLTTEMFTSVALYSARGQPDTSNAQDNIFNSATNIPLTLSGDATNGFVALVPIFYPLGESGATGAYNAPYSSSSSTGAASGASTASGSDAGAATTAAGSTDYVGTGTSSAPRSAITSAAAVLLVASAAAAAASTLLL